MAKFFKHGAYEYSFLGIEEQSGDFGLGCRCHDVAKNLASCVDGAAELGLTSRRLAGICWFVAEEEVAAGVALIGVWF